MKKTMILLLILALCAGVFGVCAYAASPSVTVTGPSTVRAGDTITVSFKLNGTGLYGFSGTLEYDSSLLTLQGTPEAKVSGWMLELGDGAFVCYDNNLSKPINSNTTMFTLTFKVSKKVEPGTKISVSCGDIIATDGIKNIDIADASYSVTIAPPRSTDNDLQEMQVSNATITPAFSADVTSYSASVPFDVSKLDVKAAAKDSKAKVTVDNPELKPGATTCVTVTVTAENGDQKVYTISVAREQDPNYVPSGNNELASITVDGFLLSPVFSSNVMEYVIWLPYETDRVSVNATTVDPLSSIQILGGDELVAGQDNEIQVICIAENGEQKVYTLIAKRAAAHGSEPTQPSEPTNPSVPSEPTDPSIPGAPTEPSAPDETQPQPTEPGMVDPPQNTEDGVPALLVIVIACVALAVGLGVGFLIGRKR